MSLRPLFLLSCSACVALPLLAAAPLAAPDSPEYGRAAQRVAQRDAELPSRERRRARNVILFVGDGMGISTLTAARILEGQQKGGSGEDNRLSFEDFPHTALVKTFSANQQTSDSAPTATAMVTGTRANDGALAVGPAVHEREADAAKVAPHALPTLLEQARARGMAVGLVTTTRITHATPAANYAHTPNRDWEHNGQLPAGATLRDIALQLVDQQQREGGLQVVLGGGREMFLPRSATDPEYADQKGRRTDGRNLVDEWLAAQPGSRFAWNKAQFDALDPARDGPMLGLFEPSHMRYELDRADDPAGEPSLADMTRKALQRLQRHGKGYYLMVEGGRIDHAHHAGNARRALVDAIALSDAVRVAAGMTDPRDTLVLVTADHSHVFTMAGYPARGNPILGLVKAPGETDFTRDFQGRPYTTLSYANGPGFGVLAQGGDAGAARPILPGRHVDLATVDTEDEGYHQESLVGLRAETHGGEDVALFARGPRAGLARGSIEQVEVYHILRRALGF
jgi:alkaline phosphatase